MRKREKGTLLEAWGPKITEFHFCCCGIILTKSNLGERGLILAHNSRLQLIPEGKWRQQQLQIPCHSTSSQQQGWNGHRQTCAQLLSVALPLTNTAQEPLPAEGMVPPSVGWAFPHLSTCNLSTPSDMPVCQLHLDNLSLRLSWVTLDCVRMRVKTDHRSTMSSVPQAPVRSIFSASFPFPKFDHQVLLWESCSSSYSSSLAFSPSAPTVAPLPAPGSFLFTSSSAIQGQPTH